RRISRRIDDEADGLLSARFLNPIDDLAFVIGLAKYHRKPVMLRGRAAEFFDVGQRGAAVELRLPAAEQIEIGSVQDIDGLRHFTGPGCNRGGGAPAVLPRL